MTDDDTDGTFPHEYAQGLEIVTDGFGSCERRTAVAMAPGQASFRRM